MGVAFIFFAFEAKVVNIRSLLKYWK
jgi:hypothetical protein